jgi:hypothetical protein
VGTAKAGNEFHGNLTADAVTTITINGNLTGHIDVTGKSVAFGKPTLGTLSVKGVSVKGVGMVGGTVNGATIVVGSTTNVGNVGTFSAIDFKNSKFFAGYDEAGPLPAVAGSFNASGGLAGTVNAFNVTGVFDNSNVAAVALKTVSLKSVTTVSGGTAFGIFADTAITTLKIAGVKQTLPVNTDNFTVQIV